MSFSLSRNDGPSALFADDETAKILSLECELEMFALFQSALVKAHFEQDTVPEGAAIAIEQACKAFKPDLRDLDNGMAQDGLMVPAYMRQLRASLPQEHREHLHFASTSQDVIDTAFMTRLAKLLPLFASRLQQLDALLEQLTTRFGSNSLQARTRMQSALPITCADRIALWKRPLTDCLKRIENAQTQTLAVQFGGPVGTLQPLGNKANATRAKLAQLLGLPDPELSWHTDRSRITDLGYLMALISGHLGKIGQDIALMAQNGIDEVTISGGGKSSAMAHKKNPILAESLVTAARFNAGQSALLNHSMIHEQERSGSAWTLEWLTLPQMVQMTGAALLIAIKQIENIESMGG